MSWLVPLLLPYFFQFGTPVAVAIVRSGLALVMPKIPKLAVPVLAAALGELMNLLPEIIAGVPGLPTGTAGPLAVFLREIADQARKLWHGEAKTIDGVPILRPGIEIPR